jgi:endonuclease/exonuclease/phosphatase family metal-dependent hydrolase
MGRVGMMTLAVAALMVAGGATVPASPAAKSMDKPLLRGDLSVLTYNVHGLPWPIARGRSADLGAIGDRLRAMRTAGRAPQVVVLQEAFTLEAQRIGRAAGYRYIVNGPVAEMAPIDTATVRRRWWSGESEGKWLGSGLQILSDYPVLATRAVVFSSCAGYDCLANKGAVLARLAVQGAQVDILTTHLNSRGASGVDNSRSDAAFKNQVSVLKQFVERAHDPRYALIVAGDFNIGKSPDRRAAVLGDYGVARRSADALHDALRQGLALPRDAITSLHRSKDWQFFASGTQAAIAVTGIAVPFGRASDGTMLSDHIGYVASYRISPITTIARPTT